jgi:GGDEF domain-containing protein
MVSIGESLSELDKMHRSVESVLCLFRRAVESAGEYAIDLEPALTGPHREAISGVAAGIEPSASPCVLADAGSAFRHHLREYRDRAAEYLEALRRELAAKASSLEQICESLTEGNDDHEAQIGKGLDLVRATAMRREAAPVRAALLEAVMGIDESMDAYRRQQQATVAQFLVEIQMLHQRVQTLENDRQRERSTMLTLREEMESQIAEVLAGSDSHCLLLLRLRNWATLRRQLGPGLDQPLLEAFSKRLRQMVGPQAVASRWETDMFAVLMPGCRSELVGMSKRVGEHVGGIYVCTIDGKLVRPMVQVDSGLIECSAGDSPERVVQRLSAFYKLRP